MQKTLLVTAGFVSLSLGIIGIVVPLLPTTPFILLASACFLRSSKKLHTWLITHPLLGNYLIAYQRFKAIPRRAKVLSLALIWISIGYSILFVVTIPWVQALLLLIATTVSIHLACLKTLTHEMQQILNQEHPYAPPQQPDGIND